MTKTHLILFLSFDGINSGAHFLLLIFFPIFDFLNTLFRKWWSYVFWQNTRIYFLKVDFWSKVILYLSLGKSTTQIAIMAMSEASRHLHLSLILWCRHSRFLARLCDKVSEWVRVRTNLKLVIIHKEVDSENGAN